MQKKTKKYSSLYVFIGVLLALCIVARTTFIDEVAQSGFAQGISHRMMDQVFALEQDDMEYLSNMQEELETSNEVREMTIAVLKQVHHPDKKFAKTIQKEMGSLIDKATAITNKTDKEKGTMLFKQLHMHMDEYVGFVLEVTDWYQAAFASEASSIQNLLNLYFFMVSPVWMIFLFALLAFCCERIMKQSETFKDGYATLGVANLRLSIFMMLCNFESGKLLITLSNRLLGRTLLNDQMFIVPFMGASVLALTFGVLYLIARKREKEEEELTALY